MASLEASWSGSTLFSKKDKTGTSRASFKNQLPCVTEVSNKVTFRSKFQK